MRGWNTHLKVFWADAYLKFLVMRIWMQTQDGERRWAASPKFWNPHISGNYPSCEDGATKPDILIVSQRQAQWWTLLWNLKLCEIHSAVAHCTSVTCVVLIIVWWPDYLDVSVTARTVDTRWLADYVLTWLGEGMDTLIKASSNTCCSSAFSESILAIAYWFAMPSVIFLNPVSADQRNQFTNFFSGCQCCRYLMYTSVL